MSENVTMINRRHDKRQGVLAEAGELISGDRNNQYGEPTQDFERTAAMWTAMLGDKLKPGEVITGSDVALLMCGLKLSRLSWQKGKRDSWVDLAGYAACGYEVAQVEAGDGLRP